MTASQVLCDVEWYSSAPQRIAITPGVDVSVHLADAGPLGEGLSPAAADLLDLAASIFLIERRLKRRRQPPTHFALRFPARDQGAWSETARAALTDTLEFLGDARWSVEVGGRRGNRALPAHQREAGMRADAVALFSGGLDSSAGAATIEPGAARLVSYYSRQRTTQTAIAAALGHAAPVQWRIARNPDPAKRALEPGRSFRYRSFFFLALGAATAAALGADRVVQFENGVLASAIPPSEAWLMTKHAHLQTQAHAGRFFGALLGGGMSIDNPFRLSTKRQCVAAAVERNAAFADLAPKTESCWHLWSNRIPGASKHVPGAKKPGKHCGVCIPCLIRRTALRDRGYARDMSRPRWQNHDRFGRDFRAYYGFLDLVRHAWTENEFYRVLPAPGRQLFADPRLGRRELFELFQAFAGEFWDTFVD